MNLQSRSNHLQKIYKFFNISNKITLTDWFLTASRNKVIDSGVSSWGFSSGKWWCLVVELYMINDGKVTSERVIAFANSGEPIQPNWKSLKWSISLTTNSKF